MLKTRRVSPTHVHPASSPTQSKWLVWLAVMLGATLEVLDSSIVNVTLPHMQGSFSTSRDEITWVLTSYIVANGIMNVGPRMPGSPVLDLTHGLITNRPRGFGMIYEALQHQAALLACNDNYRTLAMVAAVFIPAFLLLTKPSVTPASVGTNKWLKVTE